MLYKHIVLSNSFTPKDVKFTDIINYNKKTANIHILEAETWIFYLNNMVIKKKLLLNFLSTH